MNTIKISDDFDLFKIINSGQCFRPMQCADGSFRFITKDRILFIKPAGENVFEISNSEREWETVWRTYFDLDTDYRALRAAVPACDVYMKKAADAGRGIRILKQDPFETLISFIISQRKNIPAIRSCIEKICRFYGRKKEGVHLFPDAADIKSKGFEKLSECSLGYRLSYVEDAVEKVASEYMDLGKIGLLPDKELLERLMEVKGVGIKVASCVALFAYGRGAIAPVDTWIKRVIDSEYNGKSPFPGYGERGGLYQQYAFYLSTAKSL